MNELTQGIIVLAVTIVIIGVIFWLVSRQKRQCENIIRNLASSNGWIYEPVKDQNSSGCRLRKGEWMIEALTESSHSSSDNPSSTTVNSLTRWVSTGVRMKDGIVLIGPHQPEISFGNIGDMMLQMALRLMLGDEADQASGIQRVELGSLELMARYMVWTNREAIAKELLDQPLENALRAWPLKMPPVVKFSQNGLEIKIQNIHLYKEEDITALVKLGDTLLDSAYHAVKA